MQKCMKRIKNRKELDKLSNVAVRPVLNNRGVSSIDIFIIVVASIVIIVSAIFIVSNIKTLSQVNRDIEDMKIAISEKQSTLDKLIELGESEEVLRGEFERNKLFLPDDRNEIGIVSDITGIVEENDASFRTITYYDEEEKDGGIVDVPFSIRIDSTYSQLQNIITGFSSTDRLYVIESVIIMEASGSDSILSTEMRMHAYYKK